MSSNLPPSDFNFPAAPNNTPPVASHQPVKAAPKKEFSLKPKKTASEESFGDEKEVDPTSTNSASLVSLLLVVVSLLISYMIPRMPPTWGTPMGVLILVVYAASVVAAIMGITQIRKNPQRGLWMSIISLIFILLFVLIFFGVI